MYKYNLDDLYRVSFDGLEIIHRYLPESRGCEQSSTKKFKFRYGERTASAGLFRGKDDGIWRLHDFGDALTLSPIDVVMNQTGMEFYEAVQHLFAEFNVPTSNGNKTFGNHISFKENHSLPATYWKIQPKKKIENPTAYSRFVTAELLEEFGIVEVEFTERISKTGKLMRIEGSKNYPIFAYSDNLQVWAKTYCAFERERAYKHAYYGTKPQKYIHGLERIYNKLGSENFKRIEEIHEFLKENISEELKKEYRKELRELQLDYIVICSGGSDGVSLASISDEFNPIWCNSEGEFISAEIYYELKMYCHELINLPDVDTSGIEYAYKYSRQFWKLKTCFIPKYYLKKAKIKQEKIFVIF